VTLTGDPNYEGQSSYSFEVIATDAAGNTSSQTVTLGITDVIEAPPDTQGPTGTNFILNAAAIIPAEMGTQLDANTVIGTFVQTGDPNSTVFHYALGGADAGLFSLDTSTGVLSSGGANIPVSGTAYALTITAYDQANNAGPAIPVSVYVAGSGKDTITGGSGIDIMFGMNGNDSLDGTGGSDALLGGQNADTLIGGLGADQLVAGGNQDTFVYTSANDSNATNGIDTIYNFSSGGASADKIDLSAIYAGTLGFTAAASSSTTAHKVNWFESGGNTIVQADVNGDTTADLHIIIVGTGIGLDSGDFTL
jgi:Ca2+-binding RTX toxin-like protein